VYNGLKVGHGATLTNAIIARFLKVGQALTAQGSTVNGDLEVGHSADFKTVNIHGLAEVEQSLIGENVTVHGALKVGHGATLTDAAIAKLKVGQALTAQRVEVYGNVTVGHGISSDNSIFHSSVETNGLRNEFRNSSIGNGLTIHLPQDLHKSAITGLIVYLLNNSSVTGDIIFPQCTVACELFYLNQSLNAIKVKGGTIHSEGPLDLTTKQNIVLLILDATCLKGGILFKLDQNGVAVHNGNTIHVSNNSTINVDDDSSAGLVIIGAMVVLLLWWILSSVDF
jgi:hypothetical protein